MGTISQSVRGLIFALIGGICWGFSAACGQFLFVYYDLSPLWLSCVRLTFAGILLLMAALVVRSWRKAMYDLLHNRRDTIRLILFAFLGLTACQISYLLAIKYSNAATATVLQYIGPVLIVIYVCFRCQHMPRARELMAVASVIIGTFLLATHGNPATMVLSMQGLVWGLLAAVSVAAYTLLPMGLMGRYGSIPVAALAFLLGGLACTVAFRPWNIDVSLDVAGWLAVFAMITIGSAIGFAFYLQGVSDVGASKASLIASVEAVSATIFAVVWLHTAFSWIDIVGFCFIMATVFLLMERKKKNKDDAK